MSLLEQTLQQIQPDYQKDLSTVNVENSGTENIEKLGETQEIEKKKERKNELTNAQDNN
mgnify:CR=1 FL=1